MTRFIMIALTLIGLVTAFLTRSPGILGLAMLAVLVGLSGTVLSFAADRISASSRPDAAMLPPEALRAIRDKAAAKSNALRPRAEPGNRAADSSTSS